LDRVSSPRLLHKLPAFILRFLYASGKCNKWQAQPKNITSDGKRKIMLVIWKNMIFIFYTVFLKNFNFFLLKFNMIYTFWIVLMCCVKNNFLKIKKYYWHVFRHKKLFEKQPLSHYRTHSKHPHLITIAFFLFL
jgi:hypothetical protein